MARIRTIKPEFPQSESMGRVSRDARLLFVMLWPICDDHGRTRAASRMLASLLFPYDDDAPSLIDGWLDELEREGCIQRYDLEGSTYLHIPKWLTHQKIDKPSKPQFPDPPRVLASIREYSSEEGKGREGKGEEKPGDEAAPAPCKPARKKKAVLSIAQWLDGLGDAEAIPETDPVFEYAGKIGLPREFLVLAWTEFEARHRQDGKRQADWRQTFRNCVRANWYKLWWQAPEGWQLTTTGVQAQRAAA